MLQAECPDEVAMMVHGELGFFAYRGVECPQRSDRHDRWHGTCESRRIASPSSSL